MIPWPLLVVTDRHGAQRPLVETVEAVLAGGARWIWLRDRDMTPEPRRALATELLALVHAAGGQLVIGGDSGLAGAIGADGVHLGGLGSGDPTLRPHPESLPRTRSGVPARSDCREEDLQPAPRSLEPSFEAAARRRRMREQVGGTAEDALEHRIAAARAGLGAPARIGISAHTLRDIRAATAAGADYATLSPVFASPSKPGYGPALGLDGIRAAAGSGLPILALGGVDAGTARRCLAAGAAGVAVMGGLMRARDPEGETRRLLDALRAG